MKYRTLKLFLLSGLVCAPVSAFAQAGNPQRALCGPEFYPGVALRQHIGGTTRLDGVVRIDGTVGNITVVKSSGNKSLDDASVQCMRTWRYKPAEKGGKTVEDPIHMQIVWKADGDNNRSISVQDYQVADLDEKIKQAPGSAELFAARANVQMTRGDYASAVADYKKAASLSPKAINYYLQLAQAQGALHDPAALETLNKAVALEPRNTTALLARGDYQLAHDMPEAARGDYNGVLQIDPANRKVRAARAAVFVYLKQYDAARADWTYVLGGNATDDVAIGVLSFRGELAQFQGDTASALKDFDRIVELRPTVDHFNTSCWARAQFNRELDVAEKNCTAALKIAPQSPAVLDSLGFVYFRMGKYAQARDTYSQALTLSPKLASSLFMRGVTKKRLGDATANADMKAGNAQEPGVEGTYAAYGVVP